MHRLKKVFSLLLCTTVLLCGCEDNSTPSELVISEIVVSQEETPFPAVSCGEELDKAVEKAVSLSPAVTEIICELDFKDKLVGISDYCDYPEELELPKVGSTENPNLDKIIELAPDAVFTLSVLSEPDRYALNHAGIKVLTCEMPSNIEGYSAMYKEIATAFYGNEKSGSQKEETKAVEVGKNVRLSLEAAAKNVEQGSYLYVTRKLAVAGADTFESAVLSLIGENLCSELGYVEADNFGTPDYLIADSSLSEEDLAENSIFAEMIYAGAKVRFVDAERFAKPTARTAEVFSQITAEE